MLQRTFRSKITQNQKISVKAASPYLYQKAHIAFNESHFSCRV